jgi:hypothetical protein
MKKLSALLLASLLTIVCPGQKDAENTLLWKISGNGLEKPSFLYGTIHILCADDAGLSNKFRSIIRDAEEIYFEVDMDNLFEMIGAMSKMKMKGDTTFKDLYSEADYRKVKDYFEKKGSMLPFSMLETYKPLLAASTLEQKSLNCIETAIMEQVIMQEAKRSNKKISGLETMSYQADVLDSIPYKLQAMQLLTYIDSASTGDKENKQINELFEAYKSQDLGKLEELMVETDAGMSGFTDILLYHRNLNWVNKLQKLMPKKSLVIAVGAGHLPGEKGVINLLKNLGYHVTPVENKIVNTKEI